MTQISQNVCTTINFPMHISYRGSPIWTIYICIISDNSRIIGLRLWEWITSVWNILTTSKEFDHLKNDCMKIHTFSQHNSLLQSPKFCPNRFVHTNVRMKARNHSTREISNNPTASRFPWKCFNVLDIGVTN